MEAVDTVLASIDLNLRNAARLIENEQYESCSRLVVLLIRNLERIRTVISGDNFTLHLKNTGFPVAHTCSNTLELPVNYNTYQEFSKQFNAILTADENFQYSLL